MKYFLTILLIVLFNSINAQTEDKTIDNGALNPAPKFEELSQTEITSGNLINRSFLFMNHTKFYDGNIDTNNYAG